MKRTSANISNGQEADIPPIKRKRVFPLPLPERPNVLGRVWVCGDGSFGQLGLGYDEQNFERARPALLTGVRNVVDICAGGMHTLLLTDKGTVYSFGCNDEGALGRDTSEEGSEYEPVKVKLPCKAIQISAGDSHSACLLENGTVLAWGSFRGSDGNLGLTVDGNQPRPYAILPFCVCCSIASGINHLIMLSIQGQVFTVGCPEQGQLGRISEQPWSERLRSRENEYLQPREVYLAEHSRIESIWASNCCTFLKEAGTGRIFAFGLNNYKQLACGENLDIVTQPVLIRSENVKKIAGGQDHTLVLKNDGTTEAIGCYIYGRLGLGDISEDVETLKVIGALQGKRIMDIACGDATSFAINENGQLYSWGMGSNNQLGFGSEEDVLEPLQYNSTNIGNKLFLRVSSGGQHSVFLVKRAK